MFNLREQLVKEDKDLMHDYIMYNLHTENVENICDMDYLLRFWANNKMPLFHLLGDKIIVKKPITYEVSDDELENACEYLTNNFESFLNNFYALIDKYYEYNPGDKENNDIHFALFRMFDYDCLKKNKLMNINIPNIILTRGPHADKGPLKLATDMKLMRFLAKLVDWFEIDKEEFEQFRIAHSRILNDKNFDTNAVLSIHPLDYLTMSDNACNWDSCMNWERPGEYRLGTIEMMNSPVVVEAYIESNHPYYPVADYRTWSNKRWRCLYIVNKDIITEVKQYPYHNDFLSEYFLNWLRELAEENMNWTYLEMSTVYDESEYEAVDNINGLKIEITTNVMYNDYYNGHAAFVSPTVKEIKLNYSGETECMCCGEAYEKKDNFEFTSTDDIVCAKCDCKIQCSSCGRWFGKNKMVAGPDGNMYCSSCAWTRQRMCNCCGKMSWDNEDFTKSINPFMFYVYTKDHVNYRSLTMQQYICNNCYDKLNMDELEYVDSPRSWGMVHAIDIDKTPKRIWEHFIIDEGAIEYQRSRLHDYVKFVDVRTIK